MTFKELLDSCYCYDIDEYTFCYNNILFGYSVESFNGKDYYIIDSPDTDSNITVIPEYIFNDPTTKVELVKILDHYSESLKM